MRRDPDTIRRMLFEYEASNDWAFDTSDDNDHQDSGQRLYHRKLMMDEGLLIPIGKSGFRMSSIGHDYLDAIRNDTVWQRTKEGAEQLGGATLAMMKDFAIAFIKQEAAEKLGIGI